MGIQEHNISTDPKSVCIPNKMMCIDAQSSASLHGLKEEDGFLGDEFAPKVRKPYTITKQRERWTEEEHKKFLDALRLYGRAWRRIEEHVGTKTAVQIRSHAQKFFSKVVRESASNGAGTVKPIEIPPPRPKRKPVHPYPRKMENPSNNGSLAIGKWGLSSSPILSGSEHDHGSPTSVLSAFGSDTASSFLSNLPNHCTSPVDYGAGSNEQETSTEEYYRMPSLRQRNVSSIEQKQKHSPMELDLQCGSHTLTESEAPVPCFKLFGRTVMVTDSHKPSSPSAGNAMQNSMALPSANAERQNSMPLLQGALQGEFLSPGKGSGTCSSWSGGMLPMFYPLPSNYGDTMNPTEPGVMPLPWAMFGNLPRQFLHRQSLSPKQFISQPSAEASNDKECSWTGSDTASAIERGNTASSYCTELGLSVENADNVAEDYASIFGQRVGSDKSVRGCVPYKRCVVERGQHPQGMSNDGEGQCIGLCL